MKVAELIDAALNARQNAWAPYSNFKVGAALETRDGRIVVGCNIENASYGLTVCAERVAIWKALSEGESKFRRIVVVADSQDMTPPCGACRQVIWECCGDIEVVLADLKGKSIRYKMSSLLPAPFDNRFLQLKR